MKKNRFGEIIVDEDSLCDLIMQGHDVSTMNKVTVDFGFDLQVLIQHLKNPGGLLTWSFPADPNISIIEFDKTRQAHWFMPDQYKEMDIAAHVLSLCATQDQLQRAGQELLMFQERELFDLLRYLKYLVDVMRDNNVIWGVGRGSSVASYVLYLLGVHRIDSMFYDLDPAEFLR